MNQILRESQRYFASKYGDGKLYPLTGTMIFFTAGMTETGHDIHWQIPTIF